MRVPEPVPFTINAYLAFRAVLVAAENLNKEAAKREIEEIEAADAVELAGRPDVVLDDLRDPRVVWMPLTEAEARNALATSRSRTTTLEPSFRSRL